MIKLLINGHKVRMPNLFREISLDKGMQIMEVLGPNPTLNTKISIISLLSGLDVDIVSKFEEDSINTIWEKSDFHKELIQTTFYKSFALKGQLYGLIDLDNLSVKDYGDIEFWLKEGESPFSYLDKIIEVCYRPVVHKNTSSKNILINIINKLRFKTVVPKIFKHYTLGEQKEVADLFREKLDFSFAYGIINYIFQSFSKLKTEYKLLFPEKIEDEYEGTAKDKEKDLPEIWGLYFVIDSVSDNLFERDAWMNKPIRELFKYLTFKKQQSIYNGRRGNS